MSDRIGSSCLQLVLHLCLSLLAGHPVVHHARLERAGAVQRVERDQVVEALRLGFAEQLPHARALELEDPERGAFAK